MKIVELTTRVSVPITNEEADVLSKFDSENPKIYKHTLSEREQVVANQLVNKDVLLRKNDQGKIVYSKKSR